MASLSDLLSQDRVERSPPGWISALESSAGFVEGPGWLGSKEPEPAASEETAEAALAQAFARGEAAGREAAEAEFARTDNRHEKLKLRFGTLNKAAQEALAASLRETVMALCEPVLAESAIDKSAFADRCREAARRFGEAAGRFAMRLHPDDMASLEPGLLEHWSVTPDDTAERGSIVLEGEDGTLADGPAEWRAAIAESIGG